jgi:hypothetical protein
MTEQDPPRPPDGPHELDGMLHALQERAKELSCIYRIDELVRARERSLDEILRDVLEAIPPGWQYPSMCQAKIVLEGQTFRPPQFSESPWSQGAVIRVHGRAAGSVTVYYTGQAPESDEGPFLKEERRLIDAIAERIGLLLEQRAGGPSRAGTARPGFQVALDILAGTDRKLYRRIARKMLNHLAWRGIEEARQLLQRISGGAAVIDENRPLTLGGAPEDLEALAPEIFRMAESRLSEAEAASCIQGWLREDRVDFLVQALETPYTSLVEIANAMDRFQHSGVVSAELSPATRTGLVTALVRRLLTDHLGFVHVARRYLEVEDFFDLIAHTVILPRSHGRLGGKASGLLLASNIVRRSPDLQNVLAPLRIPRTWFVPSDGILHFVAFNDLDEVYSWKYRDIEQVRQEYPHVLQLFKSSRFPSEIVSGVSQALDEIGQAPIIVRSSSLLEDRAGSAFSGKYRSVFLANQGDKATRLAALLDAIAEVYASTFSPDPIQYRSERGLLEHHEEMAVMIQEVVGRRVGRYFLPAFSGVGFSRNEFRWSARIQRRDGLLRLVPGLGTRAVDRLADDYPILMAPGQPGLRINVTPDEVVRYSPSRVDVIDLDSNTFETVGFRQLVSEMGPAYPILALIASVQDHDRLRPASPLAGDLDAERLVVTFEGLVGRTPFLTQMNALLEGLEKALGVPVDIEFAHDGTDLYLLQCRPQSGAPEDAPAPIPRDLPAEAVVFSARRHVSNGTVPDITHVVYVDPEGYTALSERRAMEAVARAIGALNKVLPRRQFILMGPGRWGSRGDIRLGVGVTYADINNTALLVEIARKRGDYVPDVSFGTHFFQDLVEAQIRYLPLYPDDPLVAFNETFLRGAPSETARLVPQYAELGGVVRVIDVPSAAGGRILRVLMNADQEEAVAFLTAPARNVHATSRPESEGDPRPR